MKQQKLPQTVLALLSQDQAGADQAAWEADLEALGITGERHLKIATEGALVGVVLQTESEFCLLKFSW